MKLVKTTRGILPMRKLKLQIRKRLLRKVNLGNGFKRKSRDNIYIYNS